MTTVSIHPPDLDPAAAARRLADLGFLATSDLPDRPGPAYLLVALRPIPTLRHYDPERVDYWVSEGGRGKAATLTRDTPQPLERTFSWGLIRITDRLAVTNEYLTFGGSLTAAVVDADSIAVFRSPAPLLRRGGHSQSWDHGAEILGAFFGKLLLAVDYHPGFEAQLAAAEPIVRYAAFVDDVVSRYRGNPALRSGHPDLWLLMQGEERRLRSDAQDAWASGAELRRSI